MIKDAKVISFTSKDDYSLYGGNFMKTYYKSSLDGETTGWTVDPTTGIVRSIASASYTNNINPSLGLLKAGDQIDFSAEFIHTGHDIVFMLEYSSNANMTGVTWEEGITKITNLSTSPSIRDFTLNIKKEGYYRLYIGCYQNSPSEFKLRNLSIRINSIRSLNTIIESGTWTPSIPGTTSTSLGNYTMIGKEVTIKAQITLSSKGSGTGAVAINGLPYTPKIGQINYGNAQVTNTTLAAGYSRVYSNLALGNKTAYIRKTGNGLGNTFLTFDELANNSELFIEITYSI
jgi:hypothetical protein